MTASPAHSSLFGHVDVTLYGDIASLGDISAVTVGGTDAYDLVPTPTTLTIRLQGAPRPGQAQLVVDGSLGRAVHSGLISYDAPSTGAPLTFIAFGASLSQGTQSNGIDPHTQTWGVSGQLARALGVYLGLPLFAPTLAPPLQPSDLNPDCTQKPDTGAGINTISNTLTDPATGLFDMRRGRVDWRLTPRNVAIGGSKVSDILDGGRGTVALLEHVVEDPTIDPDDAIGPEFVSQIQRVEALDPDVGFCTDLLANDLDASVTDSADLRPDEITDLGTVQPLLVQMMGRLGKLHGQFFIANLPSLTFVPNVAILRARRIAAGTDTAASFDAKVAMIDDATDAYNAALVAAMQPYGNLHLVDFKAQVEAVAGGLDVGDQHLTTLLYGGLISLDGLHFTDTGYALYANVFIRAINAQLGLTVPEIDLVPVLAQDALSPMALKADGLQCAQ